MTVRHPRRTRERLRALRGAVARACAVAGTNLTVRWRRLRENTPKVAVAGVLLVPMAAFYVGAAVLAGHALGAMVRAGVATPATLRPLPAVGWVFAATLAAVETAQRVDSEVGDALYTALPDRDVAAALWVEVAAVAGSPVALVALAAVAVGFAAGSPVPAASVALAALALGGSALAAGVVLGLLARLALAAGHVSRRARHLGWLAAFGAYLALLVTDAVASVVAPVVASVSATPLAWGADLALLGTAGDPARAVAALLFSAALAVACVLAAGPLFACLRVAREDAA